MNTRANAAGRIAKTVQNVASTNPPEYEVPTEGANGVSAKVIDWPDTDRAPTVVEIAACASLEGATRSPSSAVSGLEATTVGRSSRRRSTEPSLCGQRTRKRYAVQLVWMPSATSSKRSCLPTSGTTPHDYSASLRCCGVGASTTSTITYCARSATH
jgi:hypothetical protein